MTGLGICSNIVCLWLGPGQSICLREVGGVYGEVMERLQGGYEEVLWVVSVSGGLIAVT